MRDMQRSCRTSADAAMPVAMAALKTAVIVSPNVQLLSSTRALKCDATINEVRGELGARTTTITSMHN
jgi:hypothetical protein